MRFGDLVLIKTGGNSEGFTEKMHINEGLDRFSGLTACFCGGL